MPLHKAVSRVFTLPFISAFPTGEDLAWRLSWTRYNLEDIDLADYFFFFVFLFIFDLKKKTKQQVECRTWLQLVPDSGFRGRACSLNENVGWPLLHNRLVAFALQGHNAGFVLH